jgi:heat shock protein HslJ
MIITVDSKWTLVVSILILAGLLGSCSGRGTSDGNIINPDLTEAEWILATINDKPGVAGVQTTLAFSDENQILGSTGCNLYNGTYALGEGDQIDFEPNVTTSWVCEVPFFAQETAMLMVLSSASTYSLDGDELKISSLEGDLIGTFTKMEPLTLEGTAWRLDALGDGQEAYIDLIEDIHVSAFFDNDGNLSGSGGCNEYNTTYVAEAVNISIGPIIATQSSCSDPEGVMDQEIIYFRALEQASSYRNYGIALMIFDVEGDLLATYLNAETASRR